MFEKATRLKLRFTTSVGPVMAEDLWDLPLTSTRGRPNLDDVARDLHKQLKSGVDVSFVTKAQKSDEIVQLKFDIVKHIIDVRLVENEAVAKAKEIAEKKQQILGLIANKENAALAEKPIEELRKLVEAM